MRFAALAIILLPLGAFILSAFAGPPTSAVGRSPGGLGRGAEPGGIAASLEALITELLSGQTVAALRFSLSQAAMSTVLAVLIGLPGAYFIATYDFAGRKPFLSLAAVPFCLPPILVILAFILYYGKNGWFSKVLAAMGLGGGVGGSGFLYSFWGLVTVHAFYNFPIIIQNVGSVWAKLPKSREEAARTLGAGRFRAFAVGSLPQLLPSLLRSASLVFLFCFFSFTIVLVFGGLSGSTLEVGIYRAIRFTGDRRRALALGAVQTAVALLAAGGFEGFGRKGAAISKGFGAVAPRKRPKPAAKAAIAAYELLIIVFFLGPLFALAAEAFTVRDSMAGAARFGFGTFARLLGPGAPLLRALLNSLSLSGLAAILATLFGAALSAAEHYAGSGRRSAWIALLPLAVSPALAAAGLSAIFGSGGRTVIVLGQLSIAWPFVARSMDASFGALERGKNEAARTLGATSAGAFLLADLPLIAPSLASAAAFAFSMTMGDANIPLLLGGGRFETLPLLLYRLTSSYRFSEACAVGIVLAIATSVAFFFKEGTNEPS
jgi:thiamine transport system permease protein